MRALSPVRPAGALLALAALAVPLLALTGPATAAEPTCQGRTATIVSDAPVVTGTEGPDVISAGPATTAVSGLGGDDVICFHGGSVRAGLGDDSVLSREEGADGRTVEVDLGEGDDTYVGSSRPDRVLEPLAFDSNPSTGADTVSTGAGDDVVVSTLGVYETNRDRIDLGDGDDTATVRVRPGSRASVVGGSGTNVLDLLDSSGGGDWTVDLAGGSLSRLGETVATVTGFGVVRSDLGGRSLGVTGTAGDDVVELVRPTPERLDIDLGGGADQVSLDSPPRTLTVRGRVDLGSGRDTLRLTDDTVVDLDLARGRLAMRPRGPAALRVAGVESVVATAPDVRLRGGRADESLDASGCRVVVRGGAGDDRITAASRLRGRLACRGDDPEPVRSRIPPRTGARLHGDAGDDTLVAGNRRDTLIGGPGRDRAVGAGGRDRCEAERETSCER